MILTDTEENLRDAMTSVGVHLSTEMLKKCVIIATNHKISPIQMATSWEAYSLNCNVNELNVHTFPCYRSILLKKFASNSSSTTGAIVSRPALGKRSIVDSDSSPNKKQSTPSLVDGTPHTPDKNLERNTPSAIVTPFKPKTDNLNQYDNRSNSGEIVCSYNPHNLPHLNRDENRKCCITQESFPHITESYFHMDDKNHAKHLDFQLTRMQHLMLGSYPIGIIGNQKDQGSCSSLQHSKKACMAEFEVTGVPRQSLQTNIGRICNEAHSGKINSTSVLIEGDRLKSNGARIPLDLNSKKGLKYSLFPGQMVAVEGINGSGRKIVVEKLCEGLQPLHPPQSGINNLGGRSDALKAYIVAGPYTTNSDLNYKPLLDLLGSVLSELPDVVFLIGPFVDVTQPLLKDGDPVLEYTEEDGSTVKRYVTYETLFAAKIAKELEDLYEDEALRTKFVLVPSLNDAIAEHV